MRYNSFNEFYSSMNVEENEIFNNWKKISTKKKRANKITILIILIIDIAIFIILRKSIKIVELELSEYYLIPIFMVDIFIFIICFIFSGYKDINKFNKDYKEIVINKLLENFVDELDYIPLKGMPANIYDEANYGGYYNRYYSDDYFEGTINNQRIKMADLRVEDEKTTTDSDGNTTTTTTTVFNGLMGKINLEKPIQCNLKIQQSTSFFSKKNKLEMDSEEFEKVFNVYTNNEIISMQLLTADIQEYILDLHKKYKIRFFINIKNDNMYVLFNTGSMFEVFSTQKEPKIVLEEYFDIMKFIYELIEKMTKNIEETQI